MAGRDDRLTDTEQLETLLEEARSEYQSEVATLEEIDDKAMRSVRTGVIIVGFVASAFGIAGPSGLTAMSLPALGTAGAAIAFLVVAVVLGLGTYTVTEYPSGVGSQYRQVRMDHEASTAALLRNLLITYDSMIGEVADEVDANLDLLDTVQFSLMVGVFFLAVSAATFVANEAYDVNPYLAAVSALAVLVVCVAGAGKLSGSRSE